MRDAAEHDAPEGFGARVRKALAKSITTDPSVVRLIRSELAKSPERNGPQERLILWRCLNAPTPS